MGPICTLSLRNSRAGGFCRLRGCLAPQSTLDLREHHRLIEPWPGHSFSRSKRIRPQREGRHQSWRSARRSTTRCRTASFLGGAPLNVAVHAAQLGAHAAYASAVGDDALGRDAKRRLEALNVDCELVQTRPGLETGFVSCVLDDNGDATYDIAYPAAWDSVHAEPSLLTAARSFDCLVHGSLALRGEETASTLREARGRRDEKGLRHQCAAPARRD